ncbi:putative succinate dehydrogenase (quinone) [Lupinus albus]|uniref:Putative succinate dehydrogenase (Quinone) n=1 Tax=Lupinus albus TaxID=3870 RepID=A0A6A4N810_LUPAL|nr:putative succinate dehydrogenase (quinone) [Lupinus albus]
MHFEGKALKWHHAYVKSLWNALPGWGEYVKVLLERFGEVCDDPMADLMKLRQKGTIGEYHEEFDAIITRLDFPAENSLSCFLGGLRNDVQMMVKMFQTQTVRKAFTLSKLYESSHTVMLKWVSHWKPDMLFPPNLCFQ